MQGAPLARYWLMRVRMSDSKLARPHVAPVKLDGVSGEAAAAGASGRLDRGALASARIASGFKATTDEWLAPAQPACRNASARLARESPGIREEKQVMSAGFIRIAEAYRRVGPGAAPEGLPVSTAEASS